MRFLILMLVLSTAVTTSFAGKISGRVTDNNNQSLSFSSIIVKGTLKGTTTNIKGEYSIQLSGGDYVLVAQHVGYKTVEKQVSVSSNESVILNFELSQQQYELGNVIVKKGEDPAYAIIRNAIKKREYHRTEIKKFQTEVYIKGQLKLRDYPDKVLGKEVDFQDGDTSKRKMIFLSETVARYSVDEPQRKIEVLSTRVSGSSDAFGFSDPNILSFYENNIQLGDLNPRGFISPISNGALNFYRYKFEGTFFENNQMVNRIRVLPKRKYEPLFNGHINIIENEWRIQSVQLVLYKENQMQLADTLKIEQLYVPYKNKWIIRQQTIYPAVKFLGFDATGNFVQVYDKFNPDPVFPKNFFNNTVIKFTDSSNKKTAVYWDSIRPLPLLQEEQRDYAKKDSLEQLRKNPHYLDSLDSKRNKLNAIAIITTGQIFTKEKRKTTLQVEGLLTVVNFNTIEGTVINLAPVFTKGFTGGRKQISITPNLRYGFSNKHFNAHVTGNYVFGNKYSRLTVAGGKRVYQFDNSNAIDPRLNTLSTLRYERNYMKIYEAAFARIAYRKELGNGFFVTATAELQDRSPLVNTTTTKWKDIPDRSFTPNFALIPHQSLVGSINFRWQPGTKYIEFPDRKVNMGSKYPIFNLTYTQGVKGILGSDVDWSKWRFEIDDELNLKLAGVFNYRLAAGGFIHQKAMHLPDFQHFKSNQLTIVSQFMNGFQLMPYYVYSNTAKLYSTAHVEYHLNGFLTNKIPFFKKLNWFLVLGNNSLYISNTDNYGEAFVGLENIFKVLRVDFVKNFAGQSIGSTGVRIALPLFVLGGGGD